MVSMCFLSNFIAFQDQKSRSTPSPKQGFNLRNFRFIICRSPYCYELNLSSKPSIFSPLHFIHNDLAIKLIQRSTRSKIWKKKCHKIANIFEQLHVSLASEPKYPASESHLKCFTSGHRHSYNQPICHFFSAGEHLQHFIIYLPVILLWFWWYVSCFSNFISTTFLLCLCHLPTWAKV